MISLFIILCLFIHNSRSKHSRKATVQASLTANNCFQILTVGSVCAIVDFLVLELFNSKRSSCRFKTILSEKLPKNKFFCVPQSA